MLFRLFWVKKIINSFLSFELHSESLYIKIFLQISGIQWALNIKVKIETKDLKSLLFNLSDSNSKDENHEID